MDRIDMDISDILHPAASSGDATQEVEEEKVVDDGNVMEEVNDDEENGGEEEEKSHTTGTRVYVGNLAYSTQWQDLKDHMRQAGDVSYADVLLDPDGRSKGCGIVEYQNPAEAHVAIKTLTDTRLHDRLIFVREDREDKKQWRGTGTGTAPSRRRKSGLRQLFVGNLPFSVSWQDLKDTFRRAGSVVRANVLCHPDGRSKGQGIVVFNSDEDADRAIQMFHLTVLDGRRIVVQNDRYA